MGLYKYDNGVLIPIAGRGKAEYGASTTRYVTWTNAEAIAVGGSVPFSAVFDVPMPDANYEVNWTCSASALHPVIDEKTASGFTGHAYRLVSPAVDSGNGVINFTAFRLYTDLEYNELLDDTEGLIKNTTESGVVNQFETTIHSQRYNKVVYTVNDDGTIALEIIQRPDTNTGLSIGLINVKAGETYKLTGGLSANERLELKNMDYSAWTNNTVNKAVSSPIVDTNVDTFMPNADATLRVYLRIDANGNTGNVGTIEPMIRFASFLDDTFIPYAKTNRLLTVETDELFANAAMLKGMTEITAQTDLDDVTTIGEYYKSSTSIYVTNAPTGIDSETSAVFRLTVENGSASTVIVQTIVKDDGTTYKRGYNGTTWSTWAEFASSSSVSGLDTRLTTAETDIDNLETSRLKTYTSDSTAWDSTPTASSTKPVTSGGIKTELDSKLPTYASDSTVWDTTPTASSTNPVTSGGILTDINSKVSHENLLDNPWFTVNQRGQSSYTALSTINTYTVDRWRLEVTGDSHHSVTVNNDSSLTITNTHSTDLLYFSQSALKKEFLVDEGTEYVASVDVVNYSGTIYVDVGLMDMSPWSRFAYGTITSTGINIFKGAVPSNWGGTVNTFRPICFVLDAGASMTIRKVKFERGAISTLHLDSAPNYQQELAKCQRYFVFYEDLRSSGDITSASKQYRICIFTPVAMRAKPTWDFSNSTIIVRTPTGYSNYTGSSFIAVTAGQVNTMSGNCLMLSDNISTSVGDSNNVVTAVQTTNVSLSADL